MRGGGLCLGTKWRRGHKWHNMVVKQGRRMTGVGYTDWHCTPCFVHLLPATPAVTCQPLQLPLATRGNDVFIFLYVHRLTHRVYTTNPPPRFPVIKDANRFHGTRGWKATFLFQRCCLADPLFPRMIKFIRSRKLGLEGI